jgi:3-phosphoglycerate kinase
MAQGGPKKEHQMSNIQDTMQIAKVTQSEATVIVDVIDREWLLDWSECTTAQFKKAIKQAQQFIANGMSWE